MKTRYLTALVVALLALAACQKTTDTTAAKENEYDIKGVVTAVAPNKTSVTLNHEEIPELNMKAMEMKYSVADPKILDGIATGDKVSGRLKAKGTDYILTKLEKR